jgi:hypothetical protein
MGERESSTSTVQLIAGYKSGRCNMSQYFRKLPDAAGLILCLLAFLSCQNPLAPAGKGGDSVEGYGTLIVMINASVAQTLLPPIDMKPAGYLISGNGPEGSTFSQPSTGSPVTIAKLNYGSWLVTVEALNAAGTVIGRGEQTVAVLTGQNASVSVSVKPLDGYGTLNVTVIWDQASVGIPRINAQLVPVAGSTVDLGFDYSTTPGTGTYSSSTIPTGYYSLVLQLLDNEVLVMGAVETVRVVKDQTTSGSYDFQQVNSIGGQIIVNIAPAMSNPISVTLSGQNTQVAQGSSMTVTASVPADAGNVVCTWYINGVSKATGQSFTVDSTLLPGHYRLDVTAFTVDGERAGSASHSFQVADVQLTQAVLEWDPNSETDLAGYKIYYGTETGQYLSVVDVGNQTTYTLAGLQIGKTYYVSATAYNSAGAESGYSNEIVFSGS